MKKRLLPEKTIERLSEYRRTLLEHLDGGDTHLYSHTLASMHGITAVQVRRDLMLIGFSSDTKKGYNTTDLIECISDILDTAEIQNVAVLGMGNLGRAITSYFRNKRDKLRIVVSLDNNPEKVGATIAGVPCRDVAEFSSVVREYGISIVLLSAPANVVAELTGQLKESGVKGVVNLSGIPLTTLNDSGIWVEDYDIITVLEKVAYFTQN